MDTLGMRYINRYTGIVLPNKDIFCLQKIYLSGGWCFGRGIIWQRLLKFFQALATPIGGIHPFHTTGTHKNTGSRTPAKTTELDDE